MEELRGQCERRTIKDSVKLRHVKTLIKVLCFVFSLVNCLKEENFQLVPTDKTVYNEEQSAKAFESIK